MAEDAGVGLLRVAADVMSLAQNQDVAKAVEVAREALAANPAGSDPDLAALWYAVAVTEHVRQDVAAQVEAANRCLEHARAADAAGWVSNGLSMRAMAHFRAGTVEAALVDLAQAEVALSRCHDDGLRNWAHTGLGYCYLESRLYELAEPHFRGALAITTYPLPLSGARAVDLMNLAELYLRWADELERATPDESAADEVERLRGLGHRFAREAVDAAEQDGPPGLLASCRATELCSRPRADAAASVSELREAYASPDHLPNHGGRATIGAALARTLWRIGARDEAIAVAREAVELSAAATDWHVGAHIQWLLVEMLAEAGLPGGTAGRDYGYLLSRVLWQQRLSTLQGARAALDVQRLHHDNRVARRAAREDALTGVGNRRALDDALAHERRLGDDHQPTSLVVVDLNEFKAVNDRHGHVVGDEVLRAVADAVRSVARAEDVVARLGGDEFVVLARGTDEEAGRVLADRVAAAIAELEVAVPDGRIRPAASVGVRTTDREIGLADLLEAADAAMYDAKHADRRRRTAERASG